MRRNSTDEREKMNRRESSISPLPKNAETITREKSKGDQKVAWIRKILQFTYKCAIMTPLHLTVR